MAVVEEGRFIKDLMGILRRHPFTVDELKEAFEILKNRMRHKTCTQCGRFVPEADGKQYLSKNLTQTRFVCGDCFEKLP